MVDLSPITDRAKAFLATPLGHSLEHAVTASATTAASLYLFGHADVRTALVSFASGAVFGIRTAVREYLKPADDPTKRRKA